MTAVVAAGREFFNFPRVASPAAYFGGLLALREELPLPGLATPLIPNRNLVSFTGIVPYCCKIISADQRPLAVSALRCAAGGEKIQKRQEPLIDANQR